MIIEHSTTEPQGKKLLSKQASDSLYQGKDQPREHILNNTTLGAQVSTNQTSPETIHQKPTSAPSLVTTQQHD